MDDHRLRVDLDGLDLDRAAVAALLSRARREVDQGHLPAAQVALAQHGRLAVFESFGAAEADSLFCIFSATKAITSSAAWLLKQDGLLDEAEIVADIVPEFATNDKGRVTVRQLFTHTCGFPSAPFRPLDWNDPAIRMKRFAQWRLNWQPGTRFEYHPTSSMWVVGEIIERRSGMSFQQFIRTRVTEPLGLPDLFVGLPACENHRVLPNVFVGDALSSDDYARMGLPEPPVTEVTESAIVNFNRPEVRAVGVPGGGGVAGAAELALFYQGLLHGGLGEQIWSPSTLADARRVRTGDLLDPVYGKLANRGFGIVIAGGDDRTYRGFAATNSPESFGHNGAGGQLAWADPKSGVSLGFCTNGHDRNPIRQARRGIAISALAAACAG